MRPRHDITTPEVDPTETIHFLRNSNEQWQATAERVARQRGAAQEQVGVFEDFVYALKEILAEGDIDSAREAVDKVIDTIIYARASA